MVRHQQVAAIPQAFQDLRTIYMNGHAQSFAKLLAVAVHICHLARAALIRMTAGGIDEGRHNKK